MLRINGLLVLVCFFLSTAHGRDLLTAYDAYFCPVLKLTDEQKAELIPHIQKRQIANHGSKFDNRTDATLFGVDLSQTKASKDLAKPEDRAVRKILWRSGARALEDYLEEKEDELKKAARNFPPLQGNFLGIQQEVSTSEAGEVDLKITVDVTVPSPKYKLVLGEKKREGETLVVKVSIIRPHLFMLMEDTPAPVKQSQVISVQGPLPAKVKCLIREIAEFDSQREYFSQFETAALQPEEQ